MSSYASLETQPLRVTKPSDINNTVRKIILGPPEVYPQDNRQKEDQLSEFNVREGFFYAKPVQDEYESAKEFGIDFLSPSFQNQITDFAQAVISKNHVYNVKQDFTRKKNSASSCYKELTQVLVLEKNKESVNEWLRNLADSVPYSDLISKKIPYFYKKDDILKELIRYQVPTTGAVWFIKITAVLYSNQMELNKKKTRSNVDSSSDWLSTIMKTLSERFDTICNKLSQTSSADHDYEIAIGEFEYLMRLIVAMYDDDLVEHSDILMWLVERFECCKFDEARLKFFLPFLLQFGDRFKETEIMTRRLLFHACKAFDEFIDGELVSAVSEYSGCSLHKSVISMLSGIITCLSLQIPSAVIWNNIRKDGVHYLGGSPLDSLPCRLSAMPVAIFGPDSAIIKETLQELEDFIMARSELVEMRWAQMAAADNDDKESAVINAVRIVDILDRYDYSINRDGNIPETLAAAVKSSCPNTNLLLNILCEWAVHPSRTGPHRPIIVAYILERLNQPLQSALTNFLDQKAPSLDQNINVDSEPFRNLVCLFAELIDRELFRPGEYISYMIARGLFEGVSQLPLTTTGSANSSGPPHLPSRSPDMERASVENPDSNRSDQSLAVVHTPASVLPNGPAIDYKSLPRHIQYLIHFPIPQNDDYFHEYSLRAQKLYHSSRNRTPHDRCIKLLIKDTNKLFTRRSLCCDVIQGERSSRRRSHVSLDRMIETIMQKFRQLSYYDMECVIAHVVPVCLQSLNPNSQRMTLTSMLLPNTKSLFMLMNMHEYSTSYSNLIRLIDQLLLYLNKLVDFVSKNTISNTAGSNINSASSSVVSLPHFTNYCLHYRLISTSLLLKYHNILMIHNELQVSILHNAANMLRSLSSSSNRCLCAFVCYLYKSSTQIQNQVPAPNNINKYDLFLNRVVLPSKNKSTNVEYSEAFAREVIYSIPNLTSERYNALSRDWNQANNFSFVVQTIIFLANCQDMDHLNKVFMFIVDMMPMTNGMCIEWMTGLYCLLMPFQCAPDYEPFAGKFKALISGDQAAYGPGVDIVQFFENISLLIANMLAKHCFSLNEFLRSIICVAMACGLEQQYPLSPNIDPTTRLTSYILHKLFTMDSSQMQNWEVHYLNLSQQKVKIELLVDLLKMLAVHSDKGRQYYQSCQLVDKDNIDSDRLINLKTWNLTLKVLREICSVQWIRMLFIKETSNVLVRDNVLIDQNISNNQANNLLNVISNPRDHQWQTGNCSNDNTEIIKQTFANLTLWSLHFDQMKIQLLLTQISEEDRRDVIESAAKDIIKIFQSYAESYQKSCNSTELDNNNIVMMNSDATTITSDSGACSGALKCSVEFNSSYLIPILIQRLPFEIFKYFLTYAAAEKLESGRHFSSHKNAQDKEKDLIKSSVILSYPPFMSLLNYCLQTEENKVEFIRSLTEQMESYIENAKETEKMPDDLRIKHLIHNSLRGRLALIGQLFNKIIDSSDLASDWCLILSKLIVYGVVELMSDHQDLFYSVLDMVGFILHQIYYLHLTGNASTKLVATMKRLKKEITEKLTYEGIELLKPFLWPCLKNMYDVVVTSPLRVGVNRYNGSSGCGSGSAVLRLSEAEISGKEGCYVVRKERINPWDMIEGVRGLFPLSWFAGVTWHEVRPPLLSVEQQAVLLLGHTHGLTGVSSARKSEGYYLEAPDVPPEDTGGNTAAAAVNSISNTGGAGIPEPGSVVSSNPASVNTPAGNSDAGGGTSIIAATTTVTAAAAASGNCNSTSIISNGAVAAGGGGGSSGASNNGIPPQVASSGSSSSVSAVSGGHNRSSANTGGNNAGNTGSSSSGAHPPAAKRSKRSGPKRQLSTPRPNPTPPPVSNAASVGGGSAGGPPSGMVLQHHPGALGGPSLHHHHQVPLTQQQLSQGQPPPPPHMMTAMQQHHHHQHQHHPHNAGATVVSHHHQPVPPPPPPQYGGPQQQPQQPGQQGQQQQQQLAGTMTSTVAGPQPPAPPPTAAIPSHHMPSSVSGGPHSHAAHIAAVAAATAGGGTPNGPPHHHPHLILRTPHHSNNPTTLTQLPPPSYMDPVAAAHHQHQQQQQQQYLGYPGGPGTAGGGPGAMLTIRNQQQQQSIQQQQQASTQHQQQQQQQQINRPSRSNAINQNLKNKLQQRQPQQQQQPQQPQSQQQSIPDISVQQQQQQQQQQNQHHYLQHQQQKAAQAVAAGLINMPPYPNNDDIISFVNAGPPMHHGGYGGPPGHHHHQQQQQPQQQFTTISVNPGYPQQLQQRSFASTGVQEQSQHQLLQQFQQQQQQQMSQRLPTGPPTNQNFNIYGSGPTSHFG